MSDKEIFDCIEKRNDAVIKSVENEIRGYTSSLTLLITTETQDIRHSIDELTKRVEKQNGSVKNLNEWKAECEGVKKEKSKCDERKTINWTKTFQVVGALIAMGMLGLGVWTLINTANKILIKQDNLGIPIETITRGHEKDTVRLFYFPNDSRRFRMIIERDTIK